MCITICIFTWVGKATGGAVVAITDNHVVAHQQCTNFLAGAMRKSCPFDGHFQIGPVVSFLFAEIRLHLMISIGMQMNSIIGDAPTFDA